MFGTYFIKELGYKQDNISTPNNLSINIRYREDLFITSNTYKIINLIHPDNLLYPNINIIILNYIDEDEESKHEKKISKEEKDEGPIYIPGKDFEDEDTIVNIIKTYV